MNTDNLSSIMSDFQDWDDWYASGTKPYIPIIIVIEEECYEPINGVMIFSKRKRFGSPIMTTLTQSHKRN